MSGSPRGYTILAGPRTGSNYLCTLLTATGKLGEPWEWFNPLNIGEVLRPGATTVELAGLIDRASTPNGVFGIKLMPWHLDSPATAPMAVAVLRQPLVLLKRRDLLGQALSRVRAMQTAQWSVRDKRLAEPHFDGPKILDALRTSAAENATFEAFLAQGGREALRLDYEDIAADPRAAVAAVAALVGVEPGNRPLSSDLTPMRDELTAEWRARFIADYGNRLSIDPIRQSDRWNRLGDKVVPLLKRIARTVRRK